MAKKDFLSPESLQEALDRFPQVLKAKEKAAKERQKRMKLFKSVEHEIFKTTKKKSQPKG